MFFHLAVILFTGGGVYPSMQWAGGMYHSMQWAVEMCIPVCNGDVFLWVRGGVYTPLDTILPGTPPPLWQTPTWADTPTVEMTIEAGGMHPTGMHSYLIKSVHSAW